MKNIMHRSTRAKDLQDEGWKIQVANICLEWALTNDKPLIFDEILEEEEEDKILENEILENDRNLENPSMTREIGKSKVGNPSGRDSENQSIDKEVGTFVDFNEFFNTLSCGKVNPITF